MATRAEMSIRTRALLIQEGRRLFSEHAYGDTTLGQVASAAGVTKGALYHHFASKEDLLKAIQEDTYDLVIARSEDIIGQQHSVVAELRALLVLHVHMVIEHRATLPASTPESRTTDSQGWSTVREKRNRIESFVVDVIERGMAEGDFEVADPRLTTYLLLGSCYWTARWYRPDGRWSLDEIADRLVTLSVRGLTGDERR
jgi:TetR/AcrR family transcriptional regulator, cholesterol catabolism regulator